MFHLVEDTYSRVQGNLIKSGQIRDSWFSFFFNIGALLVVLIGFYFFLVAPVPPPQENIEFKPQTWLNAVRNVPSTDYGQTPQIETRGSVQGINYRGSASGI
jgi:hypothetical protein